MTTTVRTPFQHRLMVLLAALWWGSISGLSFLAVPTLFAKLGSPMVAGPVAATLFSYQCTVSLVLGLLLLVLLRGRRQTDESAQLGRALGTMGFVLLAMLAALIQEFGVAQKIVTARATGGDLRLWHGLGSALVLVQWACAGWTLWRLTSDASADVVPVVAADT